MRVRLAAALMIGLLTGSVLAVAPAASASAHSADVGISVPAEFETGNTVTSTFEVRVVNHRSAKVSALLAYQVTGDGAAFSVSGSDDAFELGKKEARTLKIQVTLHGGAKAGQTSKIIIAVLPRNAQDSHPADNTGTVNARVGVPYEPDLVSSGTGVLDPTAGALGAIAFILVMLVVLAAAMVLRGQWLAAVDTGSLGGNSAIALDGDDVFEAAGTGSGHGGIIRRISRSRKSLW
jgi:hypothetical protein